MQIELDGLAYEKEQLARLDRKKAAAIRDLIGKREDPSLRISIHLEQLESLVAEVKEFIGNPRKEKEDGKENT